MGATSSSQGYGKLGEGRLSEMHLGMRDRPHSSTRTVELLGEHQYSGQKRHSHKGDHHHKRRQRRDGRHSSAEPDAWVEKMNFLLELALPAGAVDLLSDIPQLDDRALMTIANDIADRKQSNLTQVIGPTQSPHLTSPPYDQGHERITEAAYCKPDENNVFSTALSHLKETIQSKWTTISIKSRETVVKEVMQFYEQCPGTAMHKLGVKFEGENGLDVGGVTRDMIGSFWTDASQIFFHGEDILVPYLRLEKISKADNDFRVLGRILSHTVALTGTLPFNMSVTSLFSVFNSGMSSVSDSELLLQEYLMFVSREERQLMEKALSDFTSLLEDEKDFLVHIFEKHGHRCLPRKNNVKEKLTDIAAKVLIHDPTYYLQKMKEGIPESHIEVFWSRLSKSAFKQLVEQQNPTPERVAGILTPTQQLTPKETEVYSYLVNFVERLDKTSLRVFLRFVTGYTRLPKGGIKISFNHELRGALRRPIAHTCSNQLNLSVHYRNYKEFVIEMTAILYNPLSMHMYME